LLFGSQEGRSSFHRRHLNDTDKQGGQNSRERSGLERQSEHRRRRRTRRKEEEGEDDDRPPSLVGDSSSSQCSRSIGSNCSKQENSVNEGQQLQYDNEGQSKNGNRTMLEHINGGRERRHHHRKQKDKNSEDPRWHSQSRHDNKTRSYRSRNDESGIGDEVKQQGKYKGEDDNIDQQRQHFQSWHDSKRQSIRESIKENDIHDCHVHCEDEY